MQERLPFIIEQSLTPNKLVLKLYGGTANTDWVYQAPENDTDSQLIENIAWKQPEDNVYELDLSLKAGRQWGYYADYDDNNLNLHIKYPPALTPLAQGNSGPRLAGLKVCIDPGHGGTESGALGHSGITEAEINLAIALKLKTLLEAEGVNVCMTRTEDTDVSLQDRVDFARDHKVDLLISVHNNALPDGRDPLKEHGTSTYRYQPQSVELARTLKNSMVKELGLPDLGARYQNLALCRPTAMQAVLLEVAFVVNPDEYSHLINNEWQAKAAKSMLNGMLSYFGRQ
ncbi:MAG: N-acetylmuramoyl-L-alanine amidase [Candidatus Obscuribacter sp.]|nr:N-acetylmuramoyl-L-alanine amidase [Candidatus Obscuribacter sp.]